MNKEGKGDINPVLTPPIQLEGGSTVDYRAPNILQRVFGLFKNVRPGSDLTNLQLPPLFNIPKSQLQCFGESVYCVRDDMLSRCANGKSSLDRFTAVVAWSISTLRPLVFGVCPFNPILGETHHVSRGTLNVLLEQVSHHPPVAALHATDEKENLEMIWCQHLAPKFHGTSIEGTTHGKRQLKLLNHGENYVMDFPKLLIRFFPRPITDWAGNITIRCEESGLEAQLCFRGHSFLGFGGNRSVMGKIFDSSSLKTIYEINGHWDRIIKAKNIEGKVTIIYNANETISGLKTPIVQDQKALWSTESVLVWSQVSQGILNKEWEKAKEAKKAVEDKQRELSKERKSRGDAWVPKYFTVSCKEDGEWECIPKQKWVTSAPIVVPL